MENVLKLALRLTLVWLIYISLSSPCAWCVLPENVLGTFPADQPDAQVCLLSALHSHYSCERVAFSTAWGGCRGCQATAYPCHPLQPLDVNDTETPSTYTCALSEPLTMLTICT